MKALLLNPWIYDFAAYDLWLKPFGLLRVGTALRNRGWEVELLDCLDRFDPELSAYTGGELPHHGLYGRGKFPRTPIEKPKTIAGVERLYFRYGLPFELVLRKLRDREQPDLILVGTTMTYWYPGYFEVLKLAREVFPSVPTVLGGLYPRLCPEHARRNSRADLVLTGGGWEELAEGLAGLGFPPPLPPAGEEITPAWDLLRDRSALAVRTGQGCPHHCTYCATSVLEPKLERREPSAVAAEIAGYRERYGTTDIAFYDNALLFDGPNHLDRILSRLLGKGIQLRFHTPNGLHARFLTGQTAKLMKECGFLQPRLSLETSGEEEQKRTGGKVDNRDLIRALGYLEAAGYRLSEIIIYLMIGLPGQSPEAAERDIRFVHSLGAAASPAAYSPIPQTADYLSLVRSGSIAKDLDPLWQNNTIFNLRGGNFSLSAVRRLRKLAGELNRGLPGV